MPRITSLEQLIEVVESAGYEWWPKDRRFVLRTDTGPVRLVVITVRQALEAVDPERYLDRSDELGQSSEPVVWPDWAWP